jgi:hypothetical protein
VKDLVLDFQLSQLEGHVVLTLVQLVLDNLKLLSLKADRLTVPLHVLPLLTHLIPLHLDLPAFPVHPALEILGLALLASLELADLPVDLVQGDLALPLHALKVAVLLAEPLDLPVQLCQFGVKILRVVIGNVFFLFQG